MKNIFYKNVPAVVLAGGKSKRMGTNKALLQIDNVTFIERIINTFRQRFSAIYISTNDPDQFSFLDYPTITDYFSDCGPLAGIHAALKTCSTDYLIIVTCDVPFISVNVIDIIMANIESNKIVVANDGRELHPLIGVYPASVCGNIEEFLHSGERGVKRFLDRINFRAVDVSRFADELKNINTIKEYKNVYRA